MVGLLRSFMHISLRNRWGSCRSDVLKMLSLYSRLSYKNPSSSRLGSGWPALISKKRLTVEWNSLLQALDAHGLPFEYQALIGFLYRDQVGIVPKTQPFPIKRGVRQGDILSPTLFVSVLEHAMQKWKQRLGRHGILIAQSDHEQRLTNCRFADDLVIYATSLAELVEMMEMLVVELRAVGLDLNAKKSRIFTLDLLYFQSTSPIFIEVANGFMEVMRDGMTHKYLGITLPGDLRKRGQIILQERLRSAWAKFHLLRTSLLNRHVCLSLRLKLFDAVVTPSAIYGLSTAPLRAGDVEHFAAVQRKMLRLMVGYVKAEGDTWEDMYQRLKIRIGSALERRPIRLWKEECHARKRALLEKLEHAETAQILQSLQIWSPDRLNDPKLQRQPRRPRGRPRAKWHHVIDVQA